MKWITSTNIVDWSGNREFEGQLPEIIRKLIIGSLEKFPQISIPSGDSIYKPGWDGLCETKESSKYIPSGKSFWEFGRDKNYKAKCSREYTKRTKQTSSKIRRQSTFVFVTPRRWDSTPLKEKWIEIALKKKEWRDIRILDADDLESWLDYTPGVSAWLAKEKKLFSSGIEAIEDFWDKFIVSNKLTEGTILSGRIESSKEIQRFLKGKFGCLEVQSSSKTEAIAFTIASAISEGEVFKQHFFNRSIIVDNKQTLKHLTAIHSNLNIIYNSDAEESLHDSDAKSNYLVQPLSFNVNSSSVSIPLPKSSDFIKSLEDAGYTYQEASRISKECGKSFSVLNRILSKTPGRVQWNQGHNILELLPLLFVQKFDDSKPGDREIVEELSGMEFWKYCEDLKKWSLVSDRPVYQFSSHWRAVSPYDLLHVISKNITTDHLIQFQKVFEKVLNEINPALELEPKMRYGAAIFGKESRYSKVLMEGLCQTLGLLAVYGKSSGINTSYNVQQWADSIVTKLLSQREISFWLSIEGRLTLLAEASPSSFLSALEELIKKEPIVISSMFSDKDFDLFTPNYHTHILWALEGLAWDPQYLSRVALILSNLTLLGKGVKISNTPLNSLRSIFLLWLPQTFAIPEARKKVIETLIKRNKDVAFILLQKIAPKNTGDTGHYSHRQTLRLRDYVNSPVTYKELHEGISFVREKLIQVASNECSKWVDLIELIDDFTNADREELIGSLTSQSSFSGDINLLREELQSFIHKHETYSDQNWSLKPSELTKLQTLYEKITSSDIDRYYWYFNVDTIDNYRSKGDSYEELLRKTEDKRKNLISSIYKSSGLNGIIELAHRVEKAWIVGYLFAETDFGEAERVIDLLSDENERLKSMSMGFVYNKSMQLDFNWIKNQVERIKQKNSESLTTSFFLSLKPTGEVWDLLAKTSDEANSEYWKKASFYHQSFKDDVTNFIRCLKTLQHFGRYTTSINLIYYEKEKVPISIIIAGLEGLATSQVEEKEQIHLRSYAIQELFKYLDNQNADHEKMKVLEWYYLPILNDGHNDRPIKYLNRALEESPTFFAEVVSWLYKPENDSLEEIRDLSETFIRNRARNADELLDSWSHLPGENSDGSLNSQVLKDWIQKSLLECKKLNRGNRGSYTIGKLLGIARERSNSWPQNALCEIIEGFDNDEVNQGFVIGAINGSRVRASIRPAGGNAERTQAGYYQTLSLSLADQYPIVAKLMLELSQHYLSWADHLEMSEAKEEFED